MFDVVFLIGEKFSRIIVDSDRSNFVAYTIELAAAFTCVVLSGNFFHNIKTVSYLSEDRVTIVEEWSRGGGDEKLRAVCAWTCVCHGKNASAAMAKLRVKLIGKLVTWATTSGLRWIATLEHEALDHAVKRNAIVITALGEIEEICAGKRSL